MTIRIKRKDGMVIPLAALVPKVAGRKPEVFDVPHARQREQYRQSKKRGWV